MPSFFAIFNACFSLSFSNYLLSGSIFYPLDREMTHIFINMFLEGVRKEGVNYFYGRKNHKQNFLIARDKADIAAAPPQAASPSTWENLNRRGVITGPLRELGVTAEVDLRNIIDLLDRKLPTRTLPVSGLKLFYYSHRSGQKEETLLIRTKHGLEIVIWNKVSRQEDDGNV